MERSMHLLIEEYSTLLGAQPVCAWKGSMYDVRYSTCVPSPLDKLTLTKQCDVLLPRKYQIVMFPALHTGLHLYARQEM